MASGENLVVLRFAVDNAGAIVGIERVAAVSGESADKIKLSNDEVVASNEKAGLSFGGVAEKAGASKTALLGGMKGMVAAIAGYAGYEGIKGMVKSAASWQTQIAVMNRALTNAHINSRGAANNIAQATEDLSQKGGFSAPDQMAGMAQFVTQTGSVTKALKMNIATMDLARLTTKPYATSMRLVQTAMAGTPGRLSRIVGTIIPVTKYTIGLTSAWEAAHPVQYAHLQMLDKQATAQEIYTKIMVRAGNQMSAYSKSTTGAMSNAKNAIDNAGRQIGTVLLPYVTKLAQWLGKNLPGALRVVVTYFKLFNWYIKITWGSLIKFIKTNQTFHAILRLVASAFTSVWGVMKKVATFVAGDLSRTFKTIAGNIGTVIGRLETAYDQLKKIYDFAKKVGGWIFGTSGKAPSSARSKTLTQQRGGQMIPQTPGAAPSAMHGQVKSLSAIGTRKTDVNSQTTSAPAAGGGGNQPIIELHHTTKIGSRVMTTEVTRYALRQNALSGAFTAVS